MKIHNVKPKSTTHKAAPIGGINDRHKKRTKQPLHDVNQKGSTNETKTTDNK